jgi:enoyl-[acyl-carrier protein] reductase II
MLMLKKVSPTRLVKGGFFREVEEAENRGATAEELKTLLGKGRAKKGMFEGDLDNGELEIGQVASLFREQQTAAEIVHDIVTEYRNLLNESKEKLSI